MKIIWYEIKETNSQQSNHTYRPHGFGYEAPFHSRKLETNLALSAIAMPEELKHQLNSSLNSSENPSRDAIDDASLAARAHM